MINFKEKKGGAIIFLCIVIATIILIQSILYSGVLRRQQEVELHRSLQLQADQILSQYDANLFNHYGIMALKRDSIRYDFEIFNTTNRYAQDAMISAELFDALTTDDLESIINSYMRIRFPTLFACDIANRLSYIFEEMELSSFFNSADGHNVAAYIEPLQNFLSSLDHFVDLWDTIDDFADIPILFDQVDDMKVFLDDLRFVSQRNMASFFQSGERDSILLNFYEPSSIQSVAMFSENFISGDANFIATHLYINRYIVGHFNSSLQQVEVQGEKRDEHNIYGTPYVDFVDDNYPYLEFILTGIEDSEINTLMCHGAIFSLRATVNIILSLIDSDKNNTAVLLAESIAVALAIVSGGTFSIPSPVIKYIILVTWALMETIVEVDTIINGGTVPLLPIHLISDSEELDKLLGMTYRDYLGFYLLYIPTPLLLDRLQASFQRITGQTEIYTGVHLSAQYRDHLFEVRQSYDMYK